MKFTNSRSAMFSAVALAFALTGCASTAPVLNNAPATTTVAFADGQVRSSGQFSGLSDHITTGDVTIVEGTGGTQIILGENFSLDGAPDPKVGLGKGGEYDPTTAVHALASNTGEQVYLLPASINVADYDEVYIWCGEFEVGLGVAALTAK